MRERRIDARQHHVFDAHTAARMSIIKAKCRMRDLQLRKTSKTTSAKPMPAPRDSTAIMATVVIAMLTTTLA